MEIPKIPTMLELKAKALVQYYEELHEQSKTPKAYKESDHLKARKKEVAKRTKEIERQSDLFSGP